MIQDNGWGGVLSMIQTGINGRDGVFFGGFGISVFTGMTVAGVGM